MTAEAGFNTLTGLIPVIYEAMDVIPRELIGAIGASTLDPSADMAGLNQTIRSHVVPQGSLVDVTPGNVAPQGQATDLTYVDLLISNSKSYQITWAGEEQKLLAGQYPGIVKDQFAQAFRTIANAVESSLVQTAYQGASRAVGTAGTTPFATATNMTPFANSNKILDDNGASAMDRSLILGTAAKASIAGNQTILLKANEAANTSLLRLGSISDVPVQGFDLRTSGQIKTAVTAGTGSDYVTTAAYAVGANTFAVETGSGTILAGDVVTFGGDASASQYVVTSALATGTFSIGTPGLQGAVADGATVTVVGSSTRNLVIQKSGLLLATRVPAMPMGGDAASDLTTVTDPVSGLVFQVALYKQYRQILIDVALAWGSKVIRNDYVGVLLG